MLKMLVYTLDEEVKQKLLDNKQVLKVEKEVDGKKVYIFAINNMSLLMNKFTKEENSKINIVNNKMTF